MKANELMIGDWVLDGKKPAQIAGIMCDDLFETTLSLGVGGESISPIPITAEILEKNGFAYIEKDYDADGNVKYTHAYLGEDCICENTDLHIGINNNGVCCVRWLHNVIYGLQFVHELQHAFKLLYIKREIKL